MKRATRLRRHCLLMGDKVLGTQPNLVRVLIVDDHPMMRDGLRATVAPEANMEVVGEAADGVEAVARFVELEPDVTLLDLQMPKLDGLQALAAIRKLKSNAAVIVFTVYPGDARVAQALTLGATSYLLKSASRDDIIAAIQGAAEGLQTIDPELVDELEAHQGASMLTVRELGVLRLVQSGSSNKQIAETLRLSEDTVKTHLKNILGKLGATDRTQAVYVAVRRGFIEP
jgi:DNA-binding NarL/FixJ family response regulator